MKEQRGKRVQDKWSSRAPQPPTRVLGKPWSRRSSVAEVTGGYKAEEMANVQLLPTRERERNSYIHREKFICTYRIQVNTVDHFHQFFIKPPKDLIYNQVTFPLFVIEECLVSQHTNSLAQENIGKTCNSSCRAANLIRAYLYPARGGIWFQELNITKACLVTARKRGKKADLCHDNQDGLRKLSLQRILF